MQSWKACVAQCGVVINKLIINYLFCVDWFTMPTWYSHFSFLASQNVLKSKEPSFLTTLLPPNSHGPCTSPSVNASAHLPPVQSQHFEQVDKTSPYMLIYRGQNGSTDSKHMRLEVGLNTRKQICEILFQYIRQYRRKVKWTKLKGNPALLRIFCVCAKCTY